MKHTTNNILFINEHTLNGITYNYFVKYVDGAYSEAVEYCKYDEKGRTTTDEIKPEELPKHILKFMTEHKPVLKRIDEYENGDTFAEYRYK